jgi:hypothetical protein
LSLAARGVVERRLALEPRSVITLGMNAARRASPALPAEAAAAEAEPVPALKPRPAVGGRFAART